tara:strand:- start:170 stop:793 length:624 start_codon:yes stop_codon:yes gene_type:complete
LIYSNEFSTWVIFQLSSIFIVGVPFSIFIWSIKNKNKAIEKLLKIYWKVSTLFFISLILFIGGVDFSLLILIISTVLMTTCVWLWSDINRELKGYKLTNALITTTRAWRWALTFISISFLLNSFQDFSCFHSINNPECLKWSEPSRYLSQVINQLFNFLFGANFTEPIAKFLGLFALLIYTIGLFQWFIIKLPRSGRHSGFSNYGEF